MQTVTTPTGSKTFVEHRSDGSTSSFNPTDNKLAVDYCFQHQWQKEFAVPAGNFYAGETCDGVEESTANRYWLYVKTEPNFDESEY